MERHSFHTKKLGKITIFYAGFAPHRSSKQYKEGRSLYLLKGYSIEGSLNPYLTILLGDYNARNSKW